MSKGTEKRQIEARYRRALSRYSKEAAKALEGLDDPRDIVKALEKLGRSAKFREFAQTAAFKMATGMYRQNAQSWRRAARLSGKGRQIYRALKEELSGPIGGAVANRIAVNAELISSLPYDLSKEASRYIAQQSVKGRRPEDIAQDLVKRYPSLLKSRAQLIARTETSKMDTALNEARSQMLGIEWYIWRTSGDGNVRDAHAVMNGVLVRWNDPPCPEKLCSKGLKSYGHYHAGNIFNCRCYTEPVVDLSSLTFPCKVYYNGRITRMNRKQFMQIAAE